jgi:hypothetical protein
MSEPLSTAPATTGTIYDLGYKRYLGTRRPQSTRWRVIVRNQIAAAWKTWWRFKASLGLAVVCMVVVGALMLLAYSVESRAARFASSFGIQGKSASATLGMVFDTLVAISTRYLCPGAFITGLTVGAGTIAADAQVGAFTFYFARPVRPIDYVLGKLGGLFVLNLILIGAPLFLLTATRVGLSDGVSEVVANLPKLGAALATGVLGALLFSAVPLAMSAVSSRRRNAIALWAVWYMIIGLLMTGIGVATHTPELGLVDPVIALLSIAFGLYDAHPLPGMDVAVVSVGWAIAAVLLMSGAAIALAWWSVAQRAHAGVGGS